MSNTATFTKRNVYGKELTYPGDAVSYKFTLLIGSKTFNDFHLSMIKNLGYEIVIDNNLVPYAG